MMLRKKINPKMTNAIKFSDDSAYNAIRSAEVSMEKLFQRFVDCRMMSSASEAIIRVPITQGVLR